MKSKSFKLLSLMVLSIVVFITGCTSGNNEASKSPEASAVSSPSSSAEAPSSEQSNSPEATGEDKSSFTGTVKVLREWGDAQPNKAMFDALAIAFMEQYPNVKLE